MNLQTSTPTPRNSFVKLQTRPSLFLVEKPLYFILAAKSLKISANPQFVCVWKLHKHTKINPQQIPIVFEISNQMSKQKE